MESHVVNIGNFYICSIKVNIGIFYFEYIYYQGKHMITLNIFNIKVNLGII